MPSLSSLSPFDIKDDVRRIRIIGGPGSGKTTLYSVLGAELRIPVYDLDVVVYEDYGANSTTRALDARLSITQSIEARPTWITGEIHLWWTDRLIDAADVVI